MGRRKKGDKIDGWLVIDKAVGPTSTQVVGRLRRLLNAQKVGHGGTLDPLASGILPIAFGEATKTVSYAMEGDKRYSFTLRWGEATDTDDSEGEVIERSDHRPDQAEIESVLHRFVGEVRQRPPRYSAIKVEGQRAYDLARAEQEFELAERVVRVADLRLVACPDRDHAAFEVDCGKGTYVRSLARDIGQALGTFAHIVALRRQKVGSFDENDAISLESLESLGHIPAALERMLPVEAVLDDIPALPLSETEARCLRRGQALPLLSRIDRLRVEGLDNGATVLAMADGQAVALTRYDAGMLRPVRVFNL